MIAGTNGDGIPNGDDNCPLDSNTDQQDGDGDGIGDVCDPETAADLDGDGVSDDVDACLPTADGEVVNTGGCSIADLCPCDNDWKNHGAYVSCVAGTAKDFSRQGLISSAEKGAITSAAARSQCGQIPPEKHKSKKHHGKSPKKNKKHRT